jgi:hypothetical protein
MALTNTQLESIQIDYGIVYINYGETGEYLLGPTRGGGTFTVTKTLRDIEFDGSKGKTKGMQMVDDINAMLAVNSLNTSMDTLALAMPYATYAADKITCENSNVGVIADSAYLSNVTMFAKTVSGEYKKIVLFNAMAENDFSLAAAPKAEGEVALEISAHWDATDDTADLFTVEDVSSISGDSTAPTVVTVPADGATAVAVDDDLTATFSESIKQSDMTSSNFVLTKVSDGTIVSGTLTYTSASNMVTFAPDSNLDASTDYIWVITNVRDIAGNKMVTVVKNFTTA